MFEGLFTGPVRETYRSCVALARDHGTRLRVVLRLGAPELAALPWEAMWDPQEQAYLCRKEPLVRHVPAPYTPDPLPVTPPLRILGVVASPRGLPALDVERERGHLQEALERAIADGRIHLDWLENGTWDALQDHLLNSACHVLHFIGHGDYDPDLDQGRVALVREDDGRADWVEADRLIDLLREADPTPRLVVLNSCSSGQAGTQDALSGTASVLVHGGVSAVAAMQFRISDPAAVAFPRGFYKALAAGKTVEAALSSGRIAILGRGESLEWVTPVLYMRGGATQLFTIAPATPPPHQAAMATSGDSPAADRGVLEHSDQAQPAHPDLSTASAGVEADPDWNDALEAYFTEEWAAARDLLTGVLARHPGDPKAGDMLRHAGQRADHAQWYDHAQDAAAAGDWELAATELGRIVHADPGYRDAAVQLEQARWQQRRASLIDDMRRLHAAGRWQAVLAAGADLAELDPDAPDPDGMASHARQALADLDLADRYAQGLHQLENGDRVAALATFTRIEQERPTYRNTPTLLDRLNHPQSDDHTTDQHQTPDVQALVPPAVEPSTGGDATASPDAEPTARRHRWVAVLGGVILLGFVGVGLLLLGGEGRQEFLDEWEGGAVGPGWTWVNEDEAGWGFDAQGRLQITAQSRPPLKNLLVREADPPFSAKTLVRFEPTRNYEFAGLVITGPSPATDRLQFGRAFCDHPTLCVGDGLYFDRVTAGSHAGANYATPIDPVEEVYLSLEVRDGTVTAAYSYEEEGNWVVVGSHPLGPGPTRVGINASNGDPESTTNIPASFEAFYLGWE